MKRIATTIAAAALILSLDVLVLPVHNSQLPQGHKEWIANSLKEIQKIKAGMTRAELLKVFTTEGGISTGLNRRFVYRECQYIKVDVEFEAVGRAARDAEGRVTLEEDGRDIITKISKPYLEWSILD